MRAAGIVPDHSADGAAIMRRRVWRKSLLVDLGAVAQRVEHHTRLNTSVSLRGIELENLIHVLVEIQDDSDVAGLPGQASARATREDGRAELFACGDCGNYVGGVARDNEADWDLTIVGRIRRIKRAAAGIEAHFAAHSSLQLVLQFGRLRKGINGLRMRTRRQRFDRVRRLHFVRSESEYQFIALRAALYPASSK